MKKGKRKNLPMQFRRFGWLIHVLSVLAIQWSKSSQGMDNGRPWIFLSFSRGSTNNSVLSLSPYTGKPFECNLPIYVVSVVIYT